MTRPRFLPLALLAILVLGCERNPSPRFIGGTAPDFTIKDPDRTLALRELRGKVVVLNFWAAHCGPCIEEMPSLVQLQERMRDKVTVVGVSVDTSIDDYHTFLREHNIDFLTVLDADKSSYNLYGATGYPETTIIDRNGTIRRKFVGPINWTSPEIVDYLNKL